MADEPNSPQLPDALPPGKQRPTTFDQAAAQRIIAATQAVEAAGLTEGLRPKKTRDTVLPSAKARRLVIIRDIPNLGGYVLKIEPAVRHPDFAGEVSEEWLHRFIAISELPRAQAQVRQAQGEPDVEVPDLNTDPELQDMAVAPHTKAMDYELFAWPIGAETTRVTDIMPASKYLGGWHVELSGRLFLRKIADSARVGSCFPAPENLVNPPPGGP